MLRTIDETARWTVAKIRAMREKAPKIYSRKLVDVIFEQPYCRISNVVNAGIAKRQTAAEYLAKLADIGILTAVQSGREKLFIHRALLDLLGSETYSGERS